MAQDKEINSEIYQQIKSEIYQEINSETYQEILENFVISLSEDLYDYGYIF